MTVRWPQERTTPTCLVRTALHKSSQGTRLWERGTCGHLKVRRQTVLRDQEWKQPNSGELMCCEYVPWRLSLDASCHQKTVVRRLALSSLACPKEPVFEACLIGSCDVHGHFFWCRLRYQDILIQKQQEWKIQTWPNCEFHLELFKTMCWFCAGEHL